MRLQEEKVVSENTQDAGEKRRQQAPGNSRGKDRHEKCERNAVDIGDLAEQFRDAKSDGNRTGAADIVLNPDRFDLGTALDRLGWYSFAVIARDNVDADLPRLAHQLMDHGAVHHFEPARPVRFADDDLGNIVGHRVGDDLVGDVAARDRDRRGAEPLG